LGPQERWIAAETIDITGIHIVACSPTAAARESNLLDASTVSPQVPPRSGSLAGIHFACERRTAWPRLLAGFITKEGRAIVGNLELYFIT